MKRLAAKSCLKRIPIALLCVLLGLTVPGSVSRACAEAPSVTVGYLSFLQEEEKLPHAGAGYTEGFFIKDGKIVESTGKYYSSLIRAYAPGDTGSETLWSFDDYTYAEGSVFLKGRYYTLTYANHEAYILDEDMKAVASVPYGRTGWGLTTDGEHLIASDGSDCLYYMDEELNDLKTVHVSYAGIPISYLNELEYIDGAVWANIWRTNVIVIIDPDTGEVVKGIDFTGLADISSFGLSEEEAAEAVLNGIAYDAGSGRIYITGKYYPDIFVFTRK